MDKIKYTIIYLHGFASSEKSRKGQLLKNHFRNNSVITPTLSSDPKRAISEITEIITRDCFTDKLHEPLFIGSSLGGFYADYFSAICRYPAILINPLVDPLDTKDFLGKNENYSTGRSFEFKQEDLEHLLFLKKEKDKARDLTKETPEIILLAKDDNVLDFEKTGNEYQSKHQLVYTTPTGGHRFENDDMLIESIKLMNNWGRTSGNAPAKKIEGMEIFIKSAPGNDFEDFFDVHLMKLLTD